MYHSKRKSRIKAIVKASSAKKYVLKVTYATGINNVGEYTTKDGLYHALSSFTEKGLLTDLMRASLT